MTQLGVLDETTPQLMDVAQQWGVWLPSSTVYKGKHLYSAWTKCGLAGASGWMERERYESWLNKLFLPATSHLRESAPVVLFVTTHTNHPHPSLQRKEIHLRLLPFSTTCLATSRRTCMGRLKSGRRFLLSTSVKQKQVT